MQESHAGVAQDKSTRSVSERMDARSDELQGTEPEQRSRAAVVAETVPPAPYTPPADRIVTRCPTCGNQTLFIGSGGHLVCSWLKCLEPGVERAFQRTAKLLDVEHTRAANLAWVVGCVIEALNFYDSDDGHNELVRVGIAAEFKRIEGEYESAVAAEGQQ